MINGGGLRAWFLDEATGKDGDVLRVLGIMGMIPRLAASRTMTASRVSCSQPATGCATGELMGSKRSTKITFS